MTSFAVTGLNIGGTELTGASGGTLVGYGTTTAQDILNAVTLPDYPSLRAYSGLSKNVSITGYSGTAAPSGIAGDFTVDTTDTTSGAVFTGSIAPVTSPAAPVLSATAGGTIAATTYFVKITYVTAAGETLPSAEASLAVAVNNVLNVASPAAQTGVTGYNVYVSTATGTETKQNTSPIAIGTAWVEPTAGLITGVAVPAANTSGSVLTVSAVTNGTLSAYLTVNGSGVSAGTYVISLIGGTGGAGTYLVNLSQTVASVGMTADNGGTIIIDSSGRRWKRQYSGGMNPKWFGALNDGTDSSVAVNAARSALGSYGTIEIGEGTYAFNVDLGSAKISFKGVGIGKTIIKSFAANSAPITYGNNSSWDFCIIENMSITGDPGTRTKIGVQFGHQTYATGDEFAGRVVLKNVKFYDLDKCIFRLYGNIGVYVQNSYFSNANFHFWQKGITTPLMHAGNLFVRECHLDSSQLAVCYVDSPQVGTGQIAFTDCIMENNPGFLFFIKNFNDTGIGEGFLVKNTWNEGNFTASTVTIDSVAYTPKHIYAANTSHLRVEDTTMGPVQLISASISTLNCQLDAMTLTMDAASTCFHDDAVMDSCKNPVGMVRSIKRMKRPAGSFASWAKIPHRLIQAKVSPFNILRNDYFGAPVSFTGTAAKTTTNATEGVLNGQTIVQDLVINPGENEIPSGGSFNINANKYYAWFFTYRIVAGTSATFGILYNTTLVSGITIDQTKWTTIGGVCDTIGATGLPLSAYMYLTGGAATATIRMAMFALVEFDTLQDATEFINNRVAPI